MYSHCYIPLSITNLSLKYKLWILDITVEEFCYFRLLKMSLSDPLIIYFQFGIS